MSNVLGDSAYTWNPSAFLEHSAIVPSVENFVLLNGDTIFRVIRKCAKESSAHAYLVWRVLQLDSAHTDAETLITRELSSIGKFAPNDK